MGRSASVDAEKAMLTKLKNECGAGFTQKLEGMFKDMEVSKELSTTFINYLTVNYPKLAHIELGVSVLTMGNWPTYPTMQIKIPIELQQQQEVFSKFYTSKHNGRQLQWQYSLITSILKATFKPNIRKELEVSMFQALVLLCFNSKTEYSFAEIQNETQIEESELKRTLQSLACGKFRVLNKEPRGREVENDDKFIFNEQFTDRLYRIKISQVMLRETEAEHRETEEQVSQDRQYQIDAAIVRIMKTRKTLPHNLLISEIISQLRFATKAVDLKKRIESLLEREYLARDKEDCQIYHYVA
jgi:cullin-4